MDEINLRRFHMSMDFPRKTVYGFRCLDCHLFMSSATLLPGLELESVKNLFIKLRISHWANLYRDERLKKVFEGPLVEADPSDTKGALVCTISRRFYSEELRSIKNVDTAYLRRGTGGRSSFNGNVVTVFGATGFLGRFICNQLGKRGCQIIIPHRCDPDSSDLKALRLSGDLGQVLFHQFDLRDPKSIAKVVKHSNVVINLIGSNFETPNFTYYQVHTKGAREIAVACKEHNVERLLHFSSLNVTLNPEKYYLKKLGFLPSKLMGEQAVLEVFPTATIFRPGAVFGAFDKFLWPLCTNYRESFSSIPLYAKGEKTIKQPVFAGDVAQGVIVAMNDYSTRGKIIQCVGPERFLLKDIAVFCGQTLQRHVSSKTLVHDIKYDILYFLKVLFYQNVLEIFQTFPQRNMAFEFIERESVTDVVEPCYLTLLDLGVPLTKFEDIVPGLIFDFFKKYPGMMRERKNYVPVESLSPKALNDFSLN